jgi:endonuclease YncB( thermonuclease family)
VSDQQEHFSGQVVGLSDGDTLFVLRDGKSAKVRLCGIDPPEKAQAFGARACQFASELVFRQTVSVIVRDTDRYGRRVRL